MASITTGQSGPLLLGDAATRIVADARLNRQQVDFPGGWAIAHGNAHLRIFDARNRETAIISCAAAYAHVQRILVSAYALAKGGAA